MHVAISAGQGSGSSLSPQWLYFAVSSKQNVAGLWYRQRGLSILDRPRTRFMWSSDDLRKIVSPSTSPNSVSFDSEVAVFARPWGRTPSLRRDPDHPENREALRVMLEKWGRRSHDAPIDGLWFIPGWVLDAWSRPRFVALPGDEAIYVNILTDMGGTCFRPGFARGAWRPVPGASLEPLDRRLFVFDIAGAAYAPGVIRPGTILDARVLIHDITRAHRAMVDPQASIILRHAYVGAVVDGVPKSSRRMLPGEPLQDVCVGTAAGIRHYLDTLVFEDEVAQESPRPPGLTV